MTNEELTMLADLKERLKDREWRIDNLYYIKNKDGNKVKFFRNPSQKKFWNEMWYNNIILKDRQRGFSTLIALFIYDSCLFNSNIQAGIIDPTANIIEYVKKNNIDAVVMGSRGMSDLKGLLVGSVSHKVSNLIECTCIMVK